MTKDPEYDLYKAADGGLAVASKRKGKKLHADILKSMKTKKATESRKDPDGELVRAEDGFLAWKIKRDEKAEVPKEPEDPQPPEDPEAPEESEDGDADAEKPIEELSLEELKALADEKQIILDEKATKEDIIKALADNE